MVSIANYQCKGKSGALRVIVVSVNKKPSPEHNCVYSSCYLSNYYYYLLFLLGHLHRIIDLLRLLCIRASVSWLIKNKYKGSSSSLFRFSPVCTAKHATWWGFLSSLTRTSRSGQSTLTRTLTKATLPQSSCALLAMPLVPLLLTTKRPLILLVEEPLEM